MKWRLALPAFVLLSVLLTSAFPMPARADQTDARLPWLFERLRTTESAREAREIEGAIWRIWMRSDDAEVARLMTAGLDAMVAEDYRAALSAFDRMVEIAPEFAEGWNKRATVNFMLGHYAASLRDIERTLALEPRHFGALSGLGLVHSEMGEDAAALEAFERALAIHPHMPNVRRNVEALRRRIGGRDI